jgi:Fe-S cluster biogenesis protein NfuA
LFILKPRDFTLDTQTKKQIREKIELFSEYVRKDGGNIILKKIDAQNNIHLELDGACLSCPVDKEGRRRGIEEAVKKVNGKINSVYLKQGTNP